MKQLKLPISVGHSKNFGVNNINNGRACFEGYQDIGVLEGLVKGKNDTSTTLSSDVRGVRKFWDGNNFYIGVFNDNELKVYDKDLQLVETKTYTQTGDINKLSALDKIKFNYPDYSNVLYTGQVANIEDYISFEANNFIVVDTSSGSLTPGAYKDKVLSIGGSEYAITGNTFKKIFIQDVFDANINGGDSLTIYDTKNVSEYVGNFAIQTNNFKYLTGPFKNRLVAYDVDGGRLVYSYIGISTNHTNKYNSFVIGAGYNGLKILNIRGQEKLMIFGNGEIKILDFIGDILGVVATYPINKNVVDIEYYNGVVVVLTTEGLYGLDGKKINKLFDFVADVNNSYLTKEGKYLVINNVNINGNEATVVIDGFDRDYIMYGIKSFIIYENYTYILEGTQLKRYEFVNNNYADDYNYHNIEIEFNPIYNIEGFNNIAVYVENIEGKDKDFLRNNVEVQIKLNTGSYTTLSESDYRDYNGYFVLNYDLGGVKHKMDGKLILKVKSNIPIFGIYLTTTK